MPQIEQKKSTDKFFDTSDMLEVICMLYQDIEPIVITSDKTDPRRQVFTFAKSKQLERILEKLANDTLEVKPAKFLQVYKTFKNQLKYRNRKP